MPIEPLRLVPSHVTSALKPTEAASDGGPAAAARSFGAALRDAIGNLQQVQSAADQSMVQLPTGQSVDLYEVMIRAEQANLTFQLAVQVPNKLLEAYQEVVRMQM
jgi:flagellar hook-basal body complex protein FliE